MTTPSSLPPSDPPVSTEPGVPGRPVKTNGQLKRTLKILARVFSGLLLLCILLLLVLRFLILPNIDNFRSHIATQISEAIGLPVSIGHIDADWEGIHPLLTLREVRIDDQSGRPALAFLQVQAVSSWSWLFSGQINLHRLDFDEPTLHIRRLADGRLLVAGIPITEASSDRNLGNWVLLQEKIRIKGATLAWDDDARRAPPLILEDLDFTLENRSQQHTFSLSAHPPTELASRITVNGSLQGSDLSHLSEWKGHLDSAFEYADLAGWRAWVDYPFDLASGHGSLKLTGEIGDSAIRRAKAEIELENVALRLSPTLAPLEFNSLSGTVHLGFTKVDASNGEVIGEQMALTLRNNTQLGPLNFTARWKPTDTAGSIEGEFLADEIDIGAITDFAERLPLDTHTRHLLERHNPRGHLQALETRFTGNRERLDSFTLKTRFTNLGLNAYAYFPGFTHISGVLDATEKAGHVILDTQKPTLDLPMVFPEPLLDFNTLKADIDWTHNPDSGLTQINLKQIAFDGADAQGEVHGTYQRNSLVPGPGNIDLSGTLSRAEGNRVWRYMPHSVNEDARTWLKRSIRSGTATDTKLTLRGDLAQFPFRGNKNGHFLVTTRARNMMLDYAPDWPGITQLEADLRFEGEGMEIKGRGGKILDTRITSVDAVIPDFNAPEEWLHLQGRMEGDTQEFLNFIEQSPVGGKIDHFTQDMQARGQGNLALKLDMPLRHVVETAVKGIYTLNDNTLAFDNDTPPLTRINGQVAFSENDVGAENIQAAFAGLPLTLTFKNEKKDVGVAAWGHATVAQLAEGFPSTLWSKLSGGIDWRAQIDILQKGARLNLTSDLRGLTSNLPPPLAKAADSSLPLAISKDFSGKQRDALSANVANAKNKLGGPGKSAIAGTGTSTTAKSNAQTIQIKLDKLIQATLIEQQNQIKRGTILIGRGNAPDLPAQGIQLSVNLPEINIDDWQPLIQSAAPGGTAGNSQTDAGNNAYFPSPSRILLQSERLSLYSRKMHHVALHARKNKEGWQIDLNSQEASGAIEWTDTGQGNLRLRLEHLTLPEAASESTGNPPAPETSPEALKSLPGLDIVARHFAIGNRKLGQLEVNAVNRGERWQIDRLNLIHPDGRIEASGEWRAATPSAPHNTNLKIKVEASDVGKYLAELGFPDMVKQGTARIEGHIDWPDKPTGFESTRLSGAFSIDARRGQFAKIEPGVGKLLGLLSLQSLTRRFTLDFQDVFSDGFAFDSIIGNIVINNGIMSSDNLEILGPAARVQIQGDVDLKHETQRLGIIVEPDLTSTATVGTAMAIHPATGVAAIIALKLFKNPLNKIFGFAYAVTGTWNDPKVEKLSKLEPVPTATQSSTPPPANGNESPTHSTNTESRDAENRNEPKPTAPASPE